MKDFGISFRFHKIGISFWLMKSSMELEDPICNDFIAVILPNCCNE